MDSYTGTKFYRRNVDITSVLPQCSHPRLGFSDHKNILPLNLCVHVCVSCDTLLSRLLSECDGIRFLKDLDGL